MKNVEWVEIQPFTSSARSVEAMNLDTSMPDTHEPTPALVSRVFRAVPRGGVPSPLIAETATIASRR